MPRLLLTLCLLAICALAPAAPAVAAPVPPERALYEDGPDGRFLLESGWSTRADPGDVGLKKGWQRAGARAGFRGVTIPHAFNARDLSAKGFVSRVQWYRTTFRRPAGGASQWRFRFESVNRRSQVFLNGRRIGTHEGANLPFEVPASSLRAGDNELVVRVDGRLTRTDLPPAPRPQGWWNYGGILREVYLRRAGDLDLADLDLRPSNSGRVDVAAVVRNTTRQTQPLNYTIDVTGPDGSTRSFPVPGQGAVAPGALGRLQTTIQVDSPQLWSPDAPRLYDVRVRLASGQTTRAHLGFREWTRDADGRVLLNGRPLSLRGASFHEEAPGRGAALRPADRDAIVRDLKSAGADFTRQHYAPHPALLEAFDREGIVFWEQVPLWRVRGSQLRGGLRREALSRLREMIVRDRTHPSLMTWSLGNEILRGGEQEASYLRAGKALVRSLDPTRFVGIDKSISPASDVNPAYRDLDVLGVSEYLGWYGGSTADLRPSLDALRGRFPGLPLFVTEFGAESNRGGSATQKGTFAFQSDFLDTQLGVMDDTPYLNGAIVWILRDFAVRPGWSGGNPRPDPPYNRKGLFTERNAPKPALDVARRRFEAVPPTREP